MFRSTDAGDTWEHVAAAPAGSNELRFEFHDRGRYILSRTGVLHRMVEAQ